MNKAYTSWKKSGKWYNKIVGDKGHYYHQQIVLPGVIRLLKLESNSRLLDVGCGQGVLARNIPQNITYVGLDIADSLIQLAKNYDKNPKHTFIAADATAPISFKDKTFTHAAAILSLQNIEQPDRAIKNVSNCLEKNGKFIIVLNHPAYRIPRQSGWGIGENKIQYRYENLYLSRLKIPITMHPGEKHSELTWSFHYPISFYVQSLASNGFVILTMEEWTSNKSSFGIAAKMENRARSEFPLFLTIVAQKT